VLVGAAFRVPVSTEMEDEEVDVDVDVEVEVRPRDVDGVATLGGAVGSADALVVAPLPVPPGEAVPHAVSTSRQARAAAWAGRRRDGCPSAGGGRIAD